jgi:hypothetical protein
MRSTEPRLKNSETNELARIMHRFLSRSDESADLARRATEGTTGVLYGTPRSPSERQRSQGGWFWRCSREFMHGPG